MPLPAPREPPVTTATMACSACFMCVSCVIDVIEAWGGRGVATSFVRTKRYPVRILHADDGPRRGKADDSPHPNDCRAAYRGAGGHNKE